jgi:cell division protein FtsQ
MRTSQLPPNRRLSRPSVPAASPKPREERVSTVPEPPASNPEAASKKTVAEKAQKKREKKRGRTVSPRMRAWIGRLSLVTGIIVVISASVLVAWGLRRYLRSSPRFALRTIVVDGVQRLTPHYVAKRGGLEAGLNIFTVDVDAAAAAIEADPWIEKASVAKDLPDTVTVTITEREARALATVAGQLYLVDSSGEIFKELREGDPVDMPVISGVTGDEIAKDREGVRRRMRRALDVVADLERAEIAERHPIQEVAVAPDLSTTVTIGRDGITLVFGPPPYRAKIAKAARILEELRYRKLSSAVLFLDNRAHPERVVVRMK